MTGAQAAIAQLIAEGVEVVMSIPGGHNLDLCDAVLDHPELRFITARSEQEIGFVASGYSRASGRIAVPLVITGPGVGNCVTPIIDAYADSVPLVLIASHVERAFRGRGAFHEMKDQTGMVASITKWNVRVEHAEEIPEAIGTAFVQAFEGRPGPVVVEIPVDVQRQKAEVQIAAATRPKRKPARPASVRRAAQLLTEARSPVVFAGQGAILSGCSLELAQVIDRLQAACFTTAQAKGVIPEDHPLNLGWGWVQRGPAGVFLERADLVLVVGSSLDEVATQGWALPLPETLVQIDSSREMIGRNYPVSVGLVGDARAVLRQLLEKLPAKRKGEFSSPASQIAEMKGRLYSRIREKPAWHYVEAIQGALARDAVVVNDSCIANGWLMAHLQCYQPRTFNITRSMAALGYAFPAALGAKLACPQRQVLAAVGDGGFLFTDCSLATAVKYRLNVAAIVFNNDCYGSIQMKQEHSFGRTIGVSLQNPDFVALARAYGAFGCRVESPQQLHEALLEAWRRELPSVIEVPIHVGSDYF